jgi:hypothetical protein
MVDARVAFIRWTIVWTAVLVLPPGSKEIFTAYRLNFLHGLISAIVALLALYGYVDDSVASTATISYFIVDFVNMLINDFHFKVASYHTPTGRKIEYVHHVLCCSAGIMSQLVYRDFCTFDRNPFIPLMIAEISTPFLIAWRYTQSKILGLIFIILFIGCRIIYQGIYFIPECIQQCHYTVGYGFGVPYNIMNIYFLYMIFKKLIKKDKKNREDTPKAKAV